MTHYRICAGQTEGFTPRGSSEKARETLDSCSASKKSPLAANPGARMSGAKSGNDCRTGEAVRAFALFCFRGSFRKN